MTAKKKAAPKKAAKKVAAPPPEVKQYDLSEFPHEQVEKIENWLLGDHNWLKEWITGDPFVYEQFLKQVYDHCKSEPT